MPVPAVRLRYIGQGVEMGHWVAGWPCSDHDEPDHELAVAKVASGLYDVVGSADEDRDLSQRAQKKLERAEEAGEARQDVLSGDEVDENIGSGLGAASELSAPPEAPESHYSA